MATIAGSATMDWSMVSLGQVDFATHIVQASNRSDEIGAELDSGNWSLVSASPTKIVVSLWSGGRVAIGGSGFNTSNPILRSVSFLNPATHEVLRYRGNADGIGDDFLTSLTYGTTSFSETFVGHVTSFDGDPNTTNDDTYAGPVTSLTARIGATTLTLTGALNLTGDDFTASLSGTVTGIVVASGTNTIKMTGLAIDIDVIEAALADDTLSTVNDLFSVVGDQLNGDDRITYRNKSAVGMSFFGGDGNDTITISGLRGDTLNGGGGNDRLDGGLGQDTIIGEAGDDQITMLVTAGNVDTIDAGADTDTLILSGVVPGNHEVMADLSSLSDQVVSIGGLLDNLTQTNFENLNAAGIGSSVNVTGSAGANIIIGSKGNDTIDGGDGNDTLIGGVGRDMLMGGLDDDAMNGGAGNDTYFVDSIGDIVTEFLAGAVGGVDLVQSTAPSFTLGVNVEHLTLLGTDDINGTGNGLNNILTGNSGINVLTGGKGNDTYVVQNEMDLIVEGLKEGIDLVQSSAANFTLGDNVENLILMGSDHINGTGNGFKNIVTGNSGNNALDGGAGADKLIGGQGNDSYTVDLVQVGTGTTATVKLEDTITEGLNQGSDTVILRGVVDDLVRATTLTLGANLEELDASQTGTTKLNLRGNALNNNLTGNDVANVLAGLAGNDTLHGGDGNDTLDGGFGQDSVNGGAGDDRITMLVTAGNADAIDGGDGIDTLVLSGAVPGDHRVVVDLSQADQVVSIGGVIDTLSQSNLENLNAASLVGSVDVKGSSGDNVLIGSRGNDIMDGGSGNDLVDGGAGNDELEGDDGDDTLNGGLGNDTLEGNAGNDTLIGGAGNDVLEGAAGNDTMNGGIGNDTYEFGVGDGTDLIQDNSGTGDKLSFDRGLTVIDLLDLVLSRQANDLRIAIQGTTDQVTIQNWYTSPINRLEIIEAGNGEILRSSQVEQLIQAMAQFTTNTGLSWDAAAGGAGTAEQQAQFQGILAANWQ